MTKLPPLKKLNNGVELQVIMPVTTEFKIRIWIASWLIRLASYVLGCKVSFEN